MKKLLFSLIATLSLAFSAQAQQLFVMQSLTANTASNLLAGSFIIDNITVLNATTNAATLSFYDSATTSTQYVQQAYSSYTSYATNFNVIFTNEYNVIITNSYSGLFTGPTSVSISTNTRPTALAAIVPAGTTLNKDVKLITVRGLTVVPTQNATVIVTYRANNP